MATSTTNLGLTKPSVNDAADIGVLNSNFDKIDTAVAGKANSWYGLGELGVYCSDCNNAQRNGWFCIDTNTANLPDSGVSGTLFVETRPSSYGVDVYQTIKSGVTVIQRYYSSWAATWQPWEYENPPMTLGVEYRTTERWQDKVVYAKLIDFGVLPNTAHKVISTGFTEGVKIISYDGLTSFGQPIPFNGSDIDPTNIGRVELYVNPTNIWIYASRNMGGMTAQVRIKYTKD